MSNEVLHTSSSKSKCQQQGSVLTCLSCCPKTDSFQRQSFLHCSKDPTPEHGHISERGEKKLATSRTSETIT